MSSGSVMEKGTQGMPANEPSEVTTAPSPTWAGEATAHCLRPPPGAWNKLIYYSRRYGVLHASCALIGRRVPLVWRLAGPVVSRPYLARWLRGRDVKRVSLGGGSLVSEAWLCADVDPRADVYMDLQAKLPLPDSSIDDVFLDEVLEHLSEPEGERLLHNCVRVLKQGGRLRLSTPDLEYFARLCQQTSDGPASINNIFYVPGHKRLYTPGEIQALLAATGFVRIRRSWYRDAGSELARFDSHAARFGHLPEISQYWDAQKP